MNQPNKPTRVVEIEKPIPTREDERTREALSIIRCLSGVDLEKLTSWEMSVVSEIKDGRAATTVRLRELRSIYKRLCK